MPSSCHHPAIILPPSAHLPSFRPNGNATRPPAGSPTLLTVACDLTCPAPQALTEATLASALAKRPAQDGGRRRLANIVYRVHAPLKGVRGLPKWMAPALSAIAFAALAAMQMKRLR